MPSKRKNNPKSNKTSRRKKRSSVQRQLRAPSLPVLAAKTALNLAGRFLPKIMGLGTYRSSDTFKRNSLLGMGTMPPQVATSRLKSTIITHREYITDVVSSTNANTNLVSGTNLFAFPIQPANPTTFPWLSVIAQNFQEYRLLGMAFEFKSTCGSAVSSTNNAMGSVLMSTQYRAGSPPFINKSQMDNEQYSTDIVPWTNGIHYIECAPHLSPLTTLYTRANPILDDSLELFDVGTMYLATTGQQANNVVLGELWVTYQIELIKPKLGTGSAAAGPSILWGHVASTLVDNANGFGVTVSANTGNIGVTSPTGNSISIPANTFVTGDVVIIFYTVNGGSAAIFVPPSLTVSNATAFNLFFGHAAALVVSPSSGATTTSFSMTQAVLITNGALPITITVGTAGTLPGGSGSKVDVYISQADNNVQ